MNGLRFRFRVWHLAFKDVWGVEGLNPEALHPKPLNLQGFGIVVQDMGFVEFRALGLQAWS